MKLEEESLHLEIQKQGLKLKEQDIRDLVESLNKDLELLEGQLRLIKEPTMAEAQLLQEGHTKNHPAPKNLPIHLEDTDREEVTDKNKVAKHKEQEEVITKKLLKGMDPAIKVLDPAIKVLGQAIKDLEEANNRSAAAAVVLEELMEQVVVDLFSMKKDLIMIRATVDVTQDLELLIIPALHLHQLEELPLQNASMSGLMSTAGGSVKEQ